jgi:hypothetical protein
MGTHHQQNIVSFTGHPQELLRLVYLPHEEQKLTFRFWPMPQLPTSPVISRDPSVSGDVSPARAAAWSSLGNLFAMLPRASLIYPT